MYRNYGFNMRSCPCNQEKDHMTEDICNDIATLPDYDMNACGFDDENSAFPENPVLGNSYVPNQELKTTFMPNVGLKLGTIFPELVRPYMPGQSMSEIEVLRKQNEIREGCNQ